VGAAAARARCLLVSGVLPSGVLKKERGRSCSRAMIAAIGRVDRRVLAACWWLAFEYPKKSRKNGIS
jgi:hypothetical protein